MAQLESRKHISADSGFPITLHPKFNPRIAGHLPPDPVREALQDLPKDRASFADPEKKALYSVAKRVDLTESIGTVLENVQLSQLNEQQLDELALLVTERGVVFFRGQDLDTEGQVGLFQHYGVCPSVAFIVDGRSADSARICRRTGSTSSSEGKKFAIYIIYTRTHLTHRCPHVQGH